MSFDAIATALVGFMSGVLSGLFGIGGGLVTTPAIRLILGYPELVAVGTPLVVIVPTALTGAISYARRGSADVRAGLALGIWGLPASVAGAFVATLVGGDAVLVLTAALIIYMSVEMIRQARDAAGTGAHDDGEGARRPKMRLWVLGLMTGFYSGFLGLGGGFVIVPLLGRWFGYPIKRAIGTSLVAIAFLAIPGSIAHYLFGNVDLRLAVGLIVGVVPGALIGAQWTAAANERHIHMAFAGLLLLTGLVLGLTEVGLL